MFGDFRLFDQRRNTYSGISLNCIRSLVLSAPSRNMKTKVSSNEAAKAICCFCYISEKVGNYIIARITGGYINIFVFMPNEEIYAAEPL